MLISIQKITISKVCKSTLKKLTFKIYKLTFESQLKIPKLYDSEIEVLLFSKVIEFKFLN